MKGYRGGCRSCDRNVNDTLADHCAPVMHAAPDQHSILSLSAAMHSRLLAHLVCVRRCGGKLRIPCCRNLLEIKSAFSAVPLTSRLPRSANNYERHDAFHGSRCQRFQAIFVMQSRQDRRRDDSVAIRDLMPVRSRQPVDGHVGNARTEAGVWSTLVVQLDNATLIVLSFAKFVIRGIHGPVGRSPCTRH
jgi:hypothetical protein